MRTAMLVLVTLAWACPAAAQIVSSPPTCNTVAREVVVTRSDGTSLRDTLVCMSVDEIVLVRGGVLPLRDVRRITAPADSIWDGVLKGASIGLVMFAFCGGDCPVRPLLRATAGYAAIGGLIDAAQTNRTPIYRASAGAGAATVSWRIRF